MEQDAFEASFMTTQKQIIIWCKDLSFGFLFVPARRHMDVYSGKGNTILHKFVLHASGLEIVKQW